MKSTLLFLFTCCTIIAHTQTEKADPAIQWEKSFGGNSYDDAYSIQQTKNGGYIVAGWSSSDNNGDVSGHHVPPFNADYWIVKLNSFGILQWQKCLGGSKEDVAKSIEQTTDGGYIVAGLSFSNDGDVSGHHGSYYADCWIVKLDGAGNLRWQKSLGGSASDNAFSIKQTKDEGYIVSGYSYSNDGDVSGNHGGGDYWIVKLDSTGNLQWQKCLGGSATENACSIQPTTDGGYVVAGYSSSNDGDVSGNHGAEDYWIVKLDSNGNLQWQKSLGGSTSDLALSIQQTKEGGYVVAGTSKSNNGDVSGNHGAEDYWIVKLDSNGNLQWQKSLGGSAPDLAQSIQQTKDGGYLVAGYAYSTDSDISGHHGTAYNADYWVVKLDGGGNLQRENSLGGKLNDYAYSIQQTEDGNFIVAGASHSKNGDVSSHYGHIESTGYWIVKLKSPTGFADAETGISIAVDKVTTEKNTKSPVLQIQPNPSHNGIFTTHIDAIKNNLRISVTDNTGRQVYTKQLSVAQQFSINLNNKPKGVYYLHISYDGGEANAKLLVE